MLLAMTSCKASANRYSIYFFSDLQCDTERTTTAIMHLKYVYSVKVINPSKKPDYSVKKLTTSSQFEALNELQKHLSDELDVPTDHMGYIEPGHGVKGRQRWLHTDSDLKQMYESHQRRKDILLWCHSIPSSPSRSIKQKSRKRFSADSGEEDVPLRKSKTNADLYAKKLSEVEELVKKLTEKHQSVEQMNTWAHVIHMGKHESLDQPPSVPYFKKPAKKATEKDTSDVTEKEKDHVIRSPSRRISNRTQCISQLKDLRPCLKLEGLIRSSMKISRRQYLRTFLQILCNLVVLVVMQACISQAIGCLL